MVTTYKDAKKKEPTIALNGVKAWFQKSIEEEAIRGQHLFIPTHPLYEI